MSKKSKNILNLSLLNIFFIVLCLITLVPILYAVSMSFNGSNTMVSADLGLIPKNFTFKNYIAVFTQKPVLLWLGNTLILAVSTVALSLAVAIPSAYAFSRMEFKGRSSILKLIIILNAFPAILSMFAIYSLMKPLGLVNSRIGLIIIYTGTMAIFGLWNLKGYFDTVPYEIEDSARIDGATEFQVVTRILIPLAKPAIVVTAVMVLIFVWNEYIYSITFMTGGDKFTLAGGLYSLQAGEMSGSFPIFAAASLVVSLPILIIFLCVQKNMVSGLSAGGVKG